MFIVLIKDNKLIHKSESELIEINGDAIKHDKGKMIGVKGDIYVLDQCLYEVGQTLTDTEIASLSNKKDNYIKLTDDERIKNMQIVLNTILFNQG